ncbi:hypothetical protein [Geomonas azotofigens]|uniref:hypothetical protein n=1 Tax=Geomonas azotofigens TaxID=2843196 RepID=UPI001C100519|nr:hypothetical protein [Geomonas azotofigens]MBU5614605.1 hypothetical protein [Geomonas azotofigens]
MRRILALLGLIAATFNCPDAFAEAINEEVVVHPSLLMFGGVVQSASVSYDYTAHVNTRTTSASHDLREGYGFSTEVAVWNPDLLLVDVAGGVTYQQRLGNSKTSVLDYDYNVVGNAFQLSYHPMQLSTTRSTSTVSNGYMPSYSLERTSNKLTASLLHQNFPVLMFFTNSTVTSTGLSTDSTTDSNSGSINVSHNGRSWLGAAMFSFDNSSSGDKESRNYSLLLNNTFDFDVEKRYRLATKASLSDSTSVSSAGSLPQRVGALTANFSGRLGKALAVTLSDDYNYSSSVDLQSDKQVVKTNVVTGSLSHRLYQSVTTNFSGSYGQTWALGGDQTVVNGSASVDYVKLLPLGGQLKLRSLATKSVTHQNFLDTLLSARDEPHTVVQQGELIAVNLAGKLQPVVTVKSLNPEVIYRPDFDYRVDTDTGKIEVVVNGAIAPGTTLYITYEVAVNPNVDFSTDTQNHQAVLSLLGGRYILSGTYGTTDQRKIGGEATNSALTSTTTTLFSAEAHYETSIFALEYGTISGTQESSSHVAATCSYEDDYGASGHFKLGARDIYSVHDATATSQGYNQNVITASVTYSQILLQRFRLLLSANASDSRTDGVTSDLAGLRVGLDGTYNSLVVSLAAGTVYRFSSGGNTQDNNVNLKITRYF